MYNRGRWRRNIVRVMYEGLGTWGSIKEELTDDIKHCLWCLSVSSRFVFVFVFVPRNYLPFVLDLSLLTGCIYRNSGFKNSQRLIKETFTLSRRKLTQPRWWSKWLLNVETTETPLDFQQLWQRVKGGEVCYSCLWDRLI